MDSIGLDVVIEDLLISFYQPSKPCLCKSARLTHPCHPFGPGN